MNIKQKSMTTRGTVLLLVMFMTGCVGGEMGSDVGGPRTAAWKGLNSEQRAQLRSAANSGDSELVSTVGRMAWDDPPNAIALGNYAASLNPDCAEQITAAVTRACR